MVKKYEVLSDTQWEVIKISSDAKKTENKPSGYSGCLALCCKGRVAWRDLPSNFPNWSIVYYYFCQWNRNGTMMGIKSGVNMEERVTQQREATPSLILIDSQSIELAPQIKNERRYDGNKKINGRKRQILVDTGGRIWDACAHAANMYDGDGGTLLLDYDRMGYWNARCKKMLSDNHYKGAFATTIESLDIEFEVSAKLSDVPGFSVIPIRWVVERTKVFRRLVQDYERTVENSVAWLILGQYFYGVESNGCKNRIKFLNILGCDLHLSPTK
jgi:transposase